MNIQTLSVSCNADFSDYPSEYKTDIDFYINAVKGVLPVFNQFPQVQGVYLPHEEAPDSYFINDDDEPMDDLNDVGDLVWQDGDLKVFKPFQRENGDWSFELKLTWNAKHTGNQLWVTIFLELPAN